MTIEKQRPAETPIIDREKKLFEIMNGSRIGKFLDSDLLMQNWKMANDETKDKPNRNIMANIRRDLVRRIDLIDEYGEDAISHLEINPTIFNLLGRISLISDDVNTTRISGLKEYLRLNGSILFRQGETPVLMSEESLKALGEIVKKFENVVAQDN